MDNNCHIVCQLLMTYCKDPYLTTKLDEIWKKAYDEGIFHLLDGILYHRTRRTCVMILTDRVLIRNILHESHYSVVSGYLQEDRTLERVKTCYWWPNWIKDVSEYFQTCDRCQKENGSTGKESGMMIQIEEPKSPWEIVYMDWGKALPPGGYRSYSSCLVDRDPKFTLALCENIHKLFVTKLSFSKSYHPHTDSLEECLIQKLEDMIRRFCSHGLEFKESVGFTHDWCTLIPNLELAYKTSNHSSNGKALEMLEKGWNPRVPYDTLKKDLVDIHPTARSLKKIIEKARHHSYRFMQDHFKYAKERWNKSHKPPHFKVGYLVLISNLNFNNIKGINKLKYSFSGPYMIREIHGPNTFLLDLTGKLMKKHPSISLGLMNPCISRDK
ncbi:hypothetical protein O181_007196 [Austropuccinia psidii MF-1]|uniref:Integrase zinc-binding domain-containing protein n=1 Tax=Austropuccinia psidii MF-1 TaxID=1389203 RepID=A0A9Q3BMC1_9BASI|nr:hypothetical protein [Austropuccinia psidii MF-1]